MLAKVWCNINSSLGLFGEEKEKREMQDARCMTTELENKVETMQLDAKQATNKTSKCNATTTHKPKHNKQGKDLETTTNETNKRQQQTTTTKHARKRQAINQQQES
jgi:hypothetical protein